MPADENQPGWSEALKRIKDANSPRVLRLDLAGLHLTALPSSLFELRYVRELDLRGNDLTSIPDSIASLRYLQELVISDNRIVRLPQSLAELPSLRVLVASNNQIVEIPGTFGDLRTLEILVLNVNNLTAIPPSMSALARLRSLDLSHNSLTDIPQLSFPELQKLNLANNDLRFLHDGRLSLPGLRYLNLSKNRLRVIPVSIKYFPQLTELYLHDNADLEIPADILGSTEVEVREGHHEPKSPKEILDYYLETRTGSRPLNEGKLIFVGQGAVGKTSLVKALTGGGFDAGEPNTEGIQITDWSCALSTGATKVHVWDFGGQEMMHSTHRFFLTERSLYMLVLNRRLGGSDEQADYWLRLIRTFGGRNAPVIVVLNKQKREPFDVNRGLWLEKYADNIKGFVQTDCTDEASIIELRNRLIRQLEDLESIKAKFPTRWFLIKDELSQLSTDYLTLEEYRGLCASYGEPESSNQSSLAGFLHDLGIALNYRHDARLRFYVLKPAWVTDGIYTLLHAFAGQNGLFNVDDAAAALARHGYSPEATTFILTLMEQFELSFSFGERQRQILVPQLLAEQQPEATREFDVAACLNYGYKYEIVPEGLLPRFIVRTHHLSEAAYRWKHGVVLAHESSGCRALVRALPSDHEVRIHVDGPGENRRDLLAIIRYNFDVIHADYDSRPEDLVFAPGVAQKPVSLRLLRTRANNNRTTIDIELDDDELVETSIASLTEPLNTPAPLRLFLSYAHADEEYIERLRKELKLMERNGLIRPWYDRGLVAGEQWEPRILQELESADAVLVQLSPDFLASDFCVLNELANAIRRKKNGETELIAYVLRECGWKQVDGLSQFQMLPRELKPLRSWRDRDQYWRAVADGIEQSLRSLRASKPPVESLRPRLQASATSRNISSQKLPS